MTYFKPEMVPGMRKDGSQYEAMNTWFDGNNVRFKLGRPESIGGWFERTVKDFAGEVRDLNGVGRTIFQWIAGNGNKYTLVGTTWKLYLIHAGNIYDVTPLKDDNLGSGSPEAPDYSFPSFVDHNNKTTLAVRRLSKFVKIRTTYDGLRLSNTDNTFVMMFNIPFTTTGGIATADLNSGYAAATPTGEPSRDDGWQLFSEDFTGDLNYYIEIDTTVGNLAEYVGEIDDGDLAAGATTIKINNTVTQMDEGDIVKIGDEYIKLGSATGSFPGIQTFAGCTRGQRGSDDVEHADESNIEMYEKTLDVTEPSSGKIWYSIDPGVDADTSVATAYGWGAGGWSFGTWGTPSTTPATASTSLRYWNMYSNGDDVVISPTNGDIYYLSLEDITDTDGVTPLKVDPDKRRVIKLSQHGDDNGISSVKVPSRNGNILLTTLSGHLISFATEQFSGGTDKIFSPILVRWSDNDLNDKYIFDWGLRSTNTAGGYVLNSGSEIVGMLETNREILIWTDVSMYNMKYTGPPAVFSLNLISSKISLMSKNSAVAVGNSVYFMGTDSFYIYKGQLSKIPCLVSNHVFDNINTSELCKIYAFVNERFSEITWLYPSSNSFEVDMYVTYNYLEETWVTGSFDMNSIATTASSTTGKNRTAWLDASIEEYPISSFIKSFNYNVSSGPPVVTSGLLDHEYQYSMAYLDATPSCLESFIESGDISIDDGNNVFFTRKFFPDIYWTGSAPNDEANGVSVEFSSKKYPDSFSSTSTSTVKVFEPTASTSTVSLTNPIPRDGKYDIRGRGSSFSIKLSSDTSNYGWRLGDISVDVRPDGKRP